MVDSTRSCRRDGGVEAAFGDRAEHEAQSVELVEVTLAAVKV